MRKLVIVLGIIVGIAIVGVVAVGVFLDVNHYRGLVQADLQKRLDRSITLGDMHLGLLPPRFRVRDLAIADDPNFREQKPFLQAAELDVSVKLLSLLKGAIDIDSLSLQRPSVELVKNQQGVWNFSSIGANSESGSHREFSLGKLSIQDGQVAIADLKAGTPRAVYDHIDVTLRDFAPNRPFSIDAAAHLPGSGAQEVRLQGQAGPLIQNDLAATPFHGTLELKQVGIADLQKFLESSALTNTDGSLSGETKISSDSGKLAASGQMKVENPRVHGLELGYPVSAEYDLKDDLNADVLGITKLALKLGSTPLFVSGIVNLKPTPALLDLNVRAGDISIAEAARLAAAAGIAFAPGTNVSGRVTADIQARGAANKPALNGTLSGHDVQVSGKDIRQPVQVKSVNLALTPSEIRSDNFNVTSGGTTLAAQFALQQYLAKTPMVNANLRAQNAALPEVLAMAKAYGVTALDKITGAGTLNLDIHARGPIREVTSAEIMKALNGNLNLNFNNMRYFGSDISHELSSIAGFLKANEKDQGFTNISRMTGNIVVKNGIAQTNNLQALLEVGNVGAAGTANLVTQALDLRVNAVLSKAFSQQVGGTGIAGYMNTALANNEGELVIPVIVSGTFEHPRFAPDMQKVAQMKLKGLVPNFNNPSAGMAGLLGGLAGQKGGNQTQQEQQQANPVQQIMDLFGGKKKKQPPPQK
jgi:uncharacterized protein involved in outer membrane biogenesis